MASIFGIGLSRTGTTSLTEALRILGYSALHLPTLAEIKIYDAVTDITVSCRFKELDKIYPGSKFIYTVRDRASWIRSCKVHWNNLLLVRKNIPPFLEQAEMALYQTVKFDRTKLLAAYRRHDAAVREHFKDRPNDLLTLNIIDGNGWNPLCRFLKKSVPIVDFPHQNPMDINGNGIQRRLAKIN